MINICARRGIPVIHTGAHQGKVPYYKGSIFALLRSFFHYSNFSLLIKPFNATNAKITYLCNRFGHWGMLFYKYIQTWFSSFRCCFLIPFIWQTYKLFATG